MSESGRRGSATTATAGRWLVPQVRFTPWADGGVTGETSPAGPFVFAPFTAEARDEYLGHGVAPYLRPETEGVGVDPIGKI